MKYKSSLIGCGRIGCGFDDDPKREYVATHAGAYHESEDIRLVSLSDMDTGKLDKYGAKYGLDSSLLYTDYEEMLAREKPDILSICTWSSTHLEITERAVKAGVKAIFCEKPIAESIEDARRMVKLCEDAGALLFVDHQRRFDPMHQEVRDHISKGGIGEIRQVHVYYTAGIANTGSHVFDLLRFMLGDAEYVQARYSGSVSPNPDDPNMDGFVMFNNGAMCALQACDVKDYLMLEFDFVGSKGRLKLTHSGFALEYYAVCESEYFSGYKELERDDVPIDTSSPKRFMTNAVGHIVDCLEGRAEPISSGADGLAALELLCAFHESAAKDGLKINLPLEGSDISIKSR